MNILSLFDGISCGQIALNRAGIKYDQYFASEIDKHAIKVTQHNYPATIQLGDVMQVKGADLPQIDLLMGGSPCQGFSFAGKGLNFDDPRSRLFFEYVRLLKETKPKWFLLENVRMKRECQDVISEYLGVKPIVINSSLVSAQNRYRLYWANIPNVTIPADKGIMLKDVIEENYDGIYVIPRGGNPGGAQGYKGKSPSITISSWQHNFFIYKAKRNSNMVGYVGSKAQGNRVYGDAGKSPTLLAGSGGVAGAGSFLVKDGDGVRRFSPTECERLQTVPEGYTSCISDSQRYRALGNGWTVDVIAHILGGIKDQN